MTGDRRHRNDITNGQRLSRHADQRYVFYFFPHPHFLKTILDHAQTAHLQAAQAYPQPKLAKEPFFATAPIKTVFWNQIISDNRWTKKN